MAFRRKEEVKWMRLRRIRLQPACVYRVPESESAYQMPFKSASTIGTIARSLTSCLSPSLFSNRSLTMKFNWKDFIDSSSYEVACHDIEARFVVGTLHLHMKKKHFFRFAKSNETKRQMMRLNKMFMGNFFWRTKCMNTSQRLVGCVVMPKKDVAQQVHSNSLTLLSP